MENQMDFQRLVYSWRMDNGIFKSLRIANTLHIFIPLCFELIMDGGVYIDVDVTRI